MARRLAVRCLLFLLLLSCTGDTRGQDCYRIIFYNVENLFDTRDDPDTYDEEFTPAGQRHWTRERYNRKLQNLSRTLVAAAGDALPLLVGLAEVENRQVLVDLTTKTVLANASYGIIHVDSPDPRGIDVALLHAKDFRALDSRTLPVHLGQDARSRDILYCKGVLQESDTLHLFVCHFPSMIGGARQSEWKRSRAAGVLRQEIDSIQRVTPRAIIIIMGDLNSKPGAAAWKILGVKAFDKRRVKASGLYNIPQNVAQGTYRYRGKWQALDHVIVSGALLDGTHAWQVKRSAPSFPDSFLLEEDPSCGYRPLPTYRGPVYIGGYSDHLPVLLELFKASARE